MVRMIKSLTAREMFQRVPTVKKPRWGGALWSQGSWISTVGRHGNEEALGQYVKKQGREKVSKPLHCQERPLELFEGFSGWGFGVLIPRSLLRGAFMCAGHAHALGGCKSLCQPDGGEGQRSARASPRGEV